MKKLTFTMIQKQAAEIVEMKLGIKPMWKDLVFSEIEVHEEKEGDRLISAEFYRCGFPKVVYVIAYRFHEWKLIIINKDTEKELLIS